MARPRFGEALAPYPLRGGMGAGFGFSKGVDEQSSQGCPGSDVRALCFSAANACENVRKAGILQLKRVKSGKARIEPLPRRDHMREAEVACDGLDQPATAPPFPPSFMAPPALRVGRAVLRKRPAISAGRMVDRRSTCLEKLQSPS